MTYPNKPLVYSKDPFEVALGTAHGQAFSIHALEELVTVAAAASTVTTIQAPANSIILAVAVRVTVQPPGTTSVEVGDGTTAAKFNTGANVATTVGATDVGTKAGPLYVASAQAITLTPNATPSDNTGRIRVTIIYATVTPPTS